MKINQIRNKIEELEKFSKSEINQEFATKPCKGKAGIRIINDGIIIWNREPMQMSNSSSQSGYTAQITLTDEKARALLDKLLSLYSEG